jgi:hypothetical protein
MHLSVGIRASMVAPMAEVMDDLVRAHFGRRCAAVWWEAMPPNDDDRDRPTYLK